MLWRQVDWDHGMMWLELYETRNDAAVSYPFKADPVVQAALERRWAYTQDVEARTGKLVLYVFHLEGRPLNAQTNGPYYRPFKLAAEKAGVLGAVGTAKIPHNFCRSAAKRYE